MNTKAMFSSASIQWETPQGFFDRLNEEFHFTVDVCALPENAKCKRYFTPQVDGLKQSWDGVAWCNPPYGREIGDWVAKAAETAAGGVQWLCCCLPAQIQSGSTSTYTRSVKSDLSKAA